MEELYGLRPVVIISEDLARESCGSPAAALGKRFREFTHMPWHEVIGVVENVHENGVQDKAPAMVYWPSMMDGIYGPHTFDAQRTVTFVLRTDRAGTEGLLSEMRQAVWSVNANLPWPRCGPCRRFTANR